MLDIIIGTNHKPVASHALVEAIRGLGIDRGTFYVGYPILAGADERWTIDALLVSPVCGVVVFDLLDSVPTGPVDEFWNERADAQDQIVRGLMAKLVVHKELTVGRRLAFEPVVVAFGPPNMAEPKLPGVVFANQASLGAVLQSLTPLDEKYLVHLNAAIERVSTIKPRNKRANVTRTDSRGAVLKVIEKQIANLDRWQKRGAIESPEGPQRIRGLAGSGKTVVLALKAAYLHAQNPDWNIVITYQTRSLYEQFKDFVRRFCFESMNDEPDWDRVRIIPAWGTASDPGVYSEIATRNGVLVRNFNSAKERFGYSNAFAGACSELLEVQRERKVQLCDAILIDEAQDFPPSFFQLVFESVPDPKRIVWAYDELQNLNETTMPPIGDLFGFDSAGQPRLDVSSKPGEPHRDIILHKCYRNPPWALTIAHGLGFGTTRKGGLVQAFDEPALWADIGYELVAGSLDPGRIAILQRRADAAPDFFNELLNPADAFQVCKFETAAEQTRWVANEIQRNLQEDELEPTDILVIFPRAVSVPEDSGPLVAELARRGIPAHIAGVNLSRNVFFQSGSVAISGIFRAKGNEAAMVYLVNADFCASGWELLRKRNTLFTAITRSRAWVRVCGVGDDMDVLGAEIQTIIADGYKLRYPVPTAQELANIRAIHRDRTGDEKRKAETAMQELNAMLEAMERGELAFDELPSDIRRRLKSLIQPK